MLIEMLYKSTTAAAWCQLLDQTSLVAKSKLRLVDDINGLVVDSLRGVAARKDDARKKVKKKKIGGGGQIALIIQLPNYKYMNSMRLFIKS